jgi:hypothetical protein
MIRPIELVLAGAWCDPPPMGGRMPGIGPGWKKTKRITNVANKPIPHRFTIHFIFKVVRFSILKFKDPRSLPNRGKLKIQLITDQWARGVQKQNDGAASRIELNKQKIHEKENDFGRKTFEQMWCFFGFLFNQEIFRMRSAHETGKLVWLWC